MTLSRLRTTSLLAAPLIAAAVFAPAVASAADAAPADTFTLAGDAEPVPLLAGEGTETSLVPDETELDPALAAGAVTATFRVTYRNFPPAAKAAFQRAVNTWAHTVHSKVPIVIQATYQPLGKGILGQANTNKLWVNNRTHTLLVDALANKQAGHQLSSKPDIIANFSSSFNNWHFATGGAPKGTYDFQSVVTHEIGHGLGFLGAGRIVNGTAAVRSGGAAFGYDKNVENGAGKSILSFPNGSAALKNQLTSGSLFFDSPAVRRAANGRAKLFAPARWQAGSSYSHLDEKTYRQGNRNSLMTPILNDGETVHSPGPIMLAIFNTIGW